MKPTRKRESGSGALEVIEEATHLLRVAPAATLLPYYLGSIPFVLGFLYFWIEMSRSPFASQDLPEAAMLLAVLFVWMKTCHVLFGRRLRAALAGKPTHNWNLRQGLRVAFCQAVIQPSGLFIIPLSLIPVLTYPWAYAFYQNVIVLADEDSADVIGLVRRAWKQAAFRVRQNHMVLLIALPFRLFVFLNWVAMATLIPSLIKMLLGIETIFSKSPGAMLNSTFLTAVIGLTYLTVDPILKAVYAVRCFYGDSMKSGEDLKAEVKRFPLTQKLAGGLVIALLLAGGPTARGAQPEAPVAPASRPAGAVVSPDELDRRIDEVIHERKYTWRMPRGQVDGAPAKKGIILRFIEAVGDMISRAVRKVFKWIGDLWDKLFPPEKRRAGSFFGSLTTSQGLLFLLLAVVLSAIVIFLFRVRSRRKQATVVAAAVLESVPNIADENVGADQLPELGWSKLGRELVDRGEFRLAMRAFFLASLARLAHLNMIGIARFKSNRDYENELRRRGHAVPDVLEAFGENRLTFERVWYGDHAVDRGLVDEFAANVERIKVDS